MDLNKVSLWHNNSLRRKSNLFISKIVCISSQLTVPLKKVHSTFFFIFFFANHQFLKLFKVQLHFLPNASVKIFWIFFCSVNKLPFWNSGRSDKIKFLNVKLSYTEYLCANINWNVFSFVLAKTIAFSN